MDDYLFQSREGVQKPLSRHQALNILKNAAIAVGIKDNVGTHSLRKTWGYHAWKKGFNPAICQRQVELNSWGCGYYFGPKYG